MKNYGRLYAHLDVFLTKEKTLISKRLLLKIYPVLLFWILKWISEQTAVYRRSAK